MRYPIVVFLLILAACKSESKEVTKVDSTVAQMWVAYTEAFPEFGKEERPEAWYFGIEKKDANRLAKLTVNGKKKASSGLYAWYEEAGADLPKTGTQHIITDFEGKAKAIIEITKVDTIPFDKIPKDYAVLDMGTEIEPLKKWKRAHWDFFETVLKESGDTPTEDMLIVCEWFELVWPKSH